MTISVGDRLPEAVVLRSGPQGPEEVKLSELTAGRRIILFAVPGAFTPTCHSAHVPSFVRTKTQFDARGIDAIYCIAGNDPFVMKAWGEATGATAAGIGMLSDPQGEFARSIGMGLDAPARGLVGRSKRYAMYVEDGVVRVFHPEDSPGNCEVSGGEAMLAAI
ncbi:MAG: peroxiredoxin [Gemmobacter sp.]